jgi:DnaD/phage-associated family protein
MPKYRQLHTKIIDSFDFNDMPNDTVRLIWVLLPLILDCEGRGIDNVSWIRSKMFPLRSGLKDSEIQAAFDWFVSRNMIVRYSTKNHDYFYIPTFKEYQKRTERETASVLPAPVVDTQSNEVVTELGGSNDGVAAEEVVLAASASASASDYVYVSASAENKNIFQLYQSEIGMITKSISDELIDAEKEYPHEWIEYAIKEAAKNNKRSWSYATKILKRIKIEGFKQTRPQANGVLRIENMTW